MSAGRKGNIIRHVRRAAFALEANDLSDGQLLTRYLGDRDEAAFEALVRRHGPMVHGVCRRLLRHEQDAQDAFQAAFLVFFRKAASILPRDQVGRWLYGVAYRTALEARKASRRRRTRERGMRETPQPAERDAIVRQEALAQLDRELNRLPENYRMPVVLCDLEGLSRAEASRRLGWKEGTLSGRLARARQLLARRMSRHQADFSLGALAVGRMHSASPALVRATVEAARGVAAGNAASSGAVSVQVAALIERVVKVMLLEKLRISMALLLSLALLGGGVYGSYALLRAQAPAPEISKPAADASAGRERDVARADPAKPSPAPADRPRPDAPDDVGALVGDQGGEEVLPADKAEAGAPLRARKEDTFFQLKNPRFEPIGRRPFPSLVVEYRRVHEGKFGGQTLVVRGENGHDRRYLLIGPFSDRAGKIEINLGVSPPGSDGPPKNAELYLTRQEVRYPGDFKPTFKVSNSVLMGTAKLPLTLSRDWTAEETAKLRQPPPEGPKPNVHPEVGEDTAWAGDAGGGASFRYAEAGKPLIGVEYWAGEWDKEPCLARLIPVYDAKQPKEGVAQRASAKPGYAVGGLTVRTKRYVNAVRVIFMKIKPDGALDPKDSYTSDWLGADPAGAKEVALSGDGRVVIGLNCKQGAILNAVALVLGKAEEK